MSFRRRHRASGSLMGPVLPLTHSSSNALRLDRGAKSKCPDRLACSGMRASVATGLHRYLLD